MKKWMKRSVVIIFSCSFIFLLLIVFSVIEIMNSQNTDIPKYDKNELPEILTPEMIAGAMQSEKIHNVPASVTLAQIILESSGSYPGNLSLLAYECKNLFGMKGIGPAGSKSYSTGEDTGEGVITISAKFRVYHNFQESIMDHGELLTTERYKRFTKNARNSVEFAIAIHQAGYATDRNYSNKLIELMGNYNLYRFDHGGMMNGDGAAVGKFIFPTVMHAIVTSPFGNRDYVTEGASKFHPGVDLAAENGSPIYAADGGIVTFAGNGGGAGYMVKIDHGNGMETIYMHMQYGSICVSNGSKVTQGQRIGSMGSTGISTGPHLHFEIRANGQPVDPMLYILR